MVYRSTSGCDPSQSFCSAGAVAPPPEEPARQSFAASDLALLTKKLTGTDGHGLSPEQSSNLAQEIVLHEIAEQACLATGATGTAIVLEREGEMVCRASSGPNAPPLGLRMDVASGLSGECMRTRQVLRCDDAAIDPRVDVEACQRLGVRSVMVLPILRVVGEDTETIGIFEAFSALPAAFSDRDQYTLEVLAVRVLRTLERPAEPVAVLADVSEIEQPAAPPTAEGFLDPEKENSKRRSSARVLDVLTGALAAVIAVCGLWLGARAIHLGWPVQSNRAAHADLASASGSQTLDATNGTIAKSTPSSEAPLRNPSPPASLTHNSNAIPDGGLRVYDNNGREVFRMTPATVEKMAPVRDTLTNASAVASISAHSLPALEGTLLRRVEPEYPEAALQQNIEGAVVLEARIGSDGAIEEVKLVRGEPLLAYAAMAAVKQWRFYPQKKGGKTAEMQTTITLNYRLPR